MTTWVRTSDRSSHIDTVNRAAVLGMRTIGRGSQAATKLVAVLDVPPPVVKSMWREHTQTLAPIAEEEAAKCMLRSKVLPTVNTAICVGQSGDLGQ